MTQIHKSERLIVKQLMVMIVVLCVMHNMQGMEIFDRTKKSDVEFPLLSLDRKPSFRDKNDYGSFSQSLPLSKHGKNVMSPIDIFVALPPEIRMLLIKVIFGISVETNIKLNLQSQSLPLSKCLLEHLLQAKTIAPLTIGDKQIVYEDLILTTRKQRDDLVTLTKTNPVLTIIEGLGNGAFRQDMDDAYGSGSLSNPRRILASQPEHIKANLNINVRSGILWKELLVIAGVAEVGILGLLWAVGVDNPVPYIAISVAPCVVCSGFYLLQRCCGGARSYAVDRNRYV